MNLYEAIVARRGALVEEVMVDRIALYRESDLQDFYVDQVAIAKNPTSSTDTLGKKQIYGFTKMPCI